MVRPTFFARDQDQILIQGSTAAGLLRHLATGARATLTVHVLDAVIVAETAFESSANYRSAVLRGSFTPVDDGQKDQALRKLTDQLIPGRVGEVPASTRRDLAATVVLAFSISEENWIYKARSGPSGKPDPLVPDVWVGIVPMHLTAGTPVADAWIDQTTPIPPSVHALVARHQPAMSDRGGSPSAVIAALNRPSHWVLESDLVSRGNRTELPNDASR